MRVFHNNKLILESTLFTDVEEVVAFLTTKGYKTEELDYHVSLKDNKIIPTAVEVSKYNSLMLFKSITIKIGYSKTIKASVTLHGSYTYELKEIHSMW